MSQGKSDSSFDRKRYQIALSRWDNEGGAVVHESPESSTSSVSRPVAPELTNAELVRLRVRVIALENVVVALLADASERQLGLVREMAACISPQPNFTQHPLTVRAASRMTSLVQKARRSREEEPT